MRQVEEEKASFFKRWSDRKLEARETAADEKQVVATPVEAKVEKTDADMPTLESLTKDSDFSDFMSPGVSEALRKAALRKLFHMPHLNVVDGLDDYAEDFTSFEPLGDIVTHHARHMQEVEEKRRREEELERQQLAAMNEESSADDPAAESEKAHLADAHTEQLSEMQVNEEYTNSVSDPHQHN